ncbi:flavin reductase family protein [Anaeromicropila herbilytica]|nr:flavin reductase family protein [Anaeromicropila herbilytica]
MSKEFWKAGNMVYPLPAVMVSVGGESYKPNIITIGWTGTICTNPAMVYISVRPERYSYDIIKETGEFVINLTTENLVKAVDYCGVKSGRDIDKFKEMNLTAVTGNQITAPYIKECPVNIECKVEQILKLGSHDMFIAKVLGVHVDKKYMNERGKFELNKANPIVYSHGEYYGIGKLLGTFGYSIRRKNQKMGDTNNTQKERTLINKKEVNKTERNKKDNNKKEINKNKRNNIKNSISTKNKNIPNRKK